MTDVYNRTVFERNSIQSVPHGFIDSAANDLFRFMGSFWKNLHQNEKFIKGIQNVRSITLAQFYLDLIENLKLNDRRGIPVFHRELWHPLIIRKSQRNKAQENILKLGLDAVIGQQPEHSRYGEGTVLQIGSIAELDKYVTYPVSGDIKDIVSGIANNIINPTVFHAVHSEFPCEGVSYVNGTIIFPKELDPFADGSGFDVYDVGDVLEDGTGDAETVLWASDVLLDKKFISDHMSYALGIDCHSSEVTKRIINAGWDAMNCGLTPELLRTILAALLNIPVIQESDERIVRIEGEEGSEKTVTTDSHVYTISSKATLRSCVKVGSVLHRGEFIDETVKVYPMLTDVSQDHLERITEFADILKTDVPVITLPKTIIRTKTSGNLSVSWDPVPVLDSRMTDSHGRQKLYFEIGGSEEDVESFWEDVWDTADKDDFDLCSLLLDASCGDSSESSSDPEWMIVPAKFFLEYMIGGNTLVVSVDRGQAEDMSLLRDSMFFNILNSVVPSGMRLFFIEHVTEDNDDDEYNLGADGEIPSDTEEQEDTYALENMDDDEFEYSDLPGIRGKRVPNYYDQVEIKMIRNRKRNSN